MSISLHLRRATCLLIVTTCFATTLDRDAGWAVKPGASSGNTAPLRRCAPALSARTGSPDFCVGYHRHASDDQTQTAGSSDTACCRSSLLNRWTWHRTVGTEDAAVPRFGSQNSAASSAVIQDPTSICRHPLCFRCAAMRALNDRMQYDARARRALHRTG
jgi:hypothetical protein